MRAVRRWWTGTVQPRARHKNALASVQYELDQWADYGDPAMLQAAIDVRAAS